MSLTDHPEMQHHRSQECNPQVHVFYCCTGSWWWYITFTTIHFLDYVHHPVFKNVLIIIKHDFSETSLSLRRLVIWYPDRGKTAAENTLTVILSITQCVQEVLLFSGVCIFTIICVYFLKVSKNAALCFLLSSMDGYGQLHSLSKKLCSSYFYTVYSTMCHQLLASYYAKKPANSLCIHNL